MITPITETTGTDCLLLVDANEADAKALNTMLGKVGFEILTAPTGAKALKVLAVRRPDLILLNVQLPDMGGFEVCRRIQEQVEWAEIPIIFLSDDKDRGMVALALESGGVDYIIKPFHKQELLSRVRTQLMLKTSHDHAKRLAQDKDEMLGMISHHLQNHLVGLHMSAQFLLDRTQTGADPKLRLLAENIRSSSGQMRAFLKGFLANAAADHGVLIKLEAVSLAHAAMRAVQQYQDAAKAKDITVRVAMADEGTLVRADASALGQILDNLISNAIKFSPPAKEILVTVQATPRYVEFRIQDHGVGFSDEDKARMFHRYARLSAKPTAGEPSTGLGLSIVQKLVRAMNGELICESATQKGTTFIVRLAHSPERTAELDIKHLTKRMAYPRSNAIRPQLQSSPPA